MTERSAAATELARRLWSRADNDGSTPEKVAEAADLLCTNLRSGLSRWVGTDGYRTLLARALLLVRVEHPAMDGLSCLGEDASEATTAVRVHGADKVTAGLVALVATLIELLARIIGDEMSLRLVDKIGTLSPREMASVETKGGRDG